MKLFEKISGVVTRVDEKGRGVLPKDGKNVVVHFAIPEDEVVATLTKRKRGELHARVDEIVKPSPARVVPKCPYVGKCGGCPWQMVDYPKQLEYKRDLVNKTFAAHGLHIDTVVPSREIFYFRNRMDYVFGAQGELGLKEPERWWSVLNLSTCFLLSEDTVRVMERMREWAKRYTLPFWDNRKYTGLLRYVVIREGKFTGERAVTIVTSSESFPDTARADLITTLKDLTTTLYWGVNPEITDLSIAENMTLLSGKPYLTERVGEYTFSIHPNSFFQTNSYMAPVLMETVREFSALTTDERLLDLYCGAGFFGIGLGKSAQEVIGIELDHRAIDLAKENAAANGVTNITFLQGAAEDMVSKVPRPDVAIIDPPRSGLHPRALKTLLAFEPKRIVYVSCNYQALARELPELQKNYTVTQCRALDLFPHTPHVEVVTKFERKQVSNSRE